MSADQALGLEALDFEWRILNAYRKPLPVDKFPVNLALTTAKPVVGQPLGIVDSSSAETTWATVNATPQIGPDGKVTRVVWAVMSLLFTWMAWEPS